MSLCLFSPDTVRCRSRWVSQYEDRHTRQDLRAFSLVPAQISQGTSPATATSKDFFMADCLSWATISDMKMLTCTSVLESKYFLQTGHSRLLLILQFLMMQALQKLCPHCMVTGAVNTSRQTGHRKLSSHSTQLTAAMLGPKVWIWHKVSTEVLNSSNVELLDCWFVKCVVQCAHA